MHDTLPRRYLIFIFVFSSLLLSSFVYVLYRQTRTIETSYSWVTHSYEVLRLTRYVLTDIQDMEAGYRGYMLTHTKEFYGAYEQGNARVNSGLDSLQQAVSDNPGQVSRVQNIKGPVRNYQSLVARLLKTPSGSIAEDLRADRLAMEKVREGADSFIAEETRLLNERTRVTQNRQDQYQMTLLLGCGLALGGLLVANGIIIAQMNSNKQSETALKASKERFITVMNAVQHGIFDYNVPEGTIYYSPSFKKILGYEDSEMPNTLDEFNNRLHLDDREKTKEVSRRFFSHESKEYINYFRMRHKDGTYRWIMSRGVGIWNADGSISRLIGTHTDITDQKRAEERLRNMNEDLESFTYIASHDLRAPLVNMKGFAGEMQMSVDNITPIVDRLASGMDAADAEKLKTALHEDMPEAIRFIRSSVEKMDVLTNAILDLSRIGRRELKPEQVDAAQIVERCVNSLAYEISSRGIKVETGPLPVIVTDALALEQIFGNLLDNAVKYLDPQRSGRISIEAEKMQGDVRFSVRDNGRGIAREDYGKVFDIFRRASNSADVRGAGMGMAYVQATLRRLGGRIWFDSRLHDGTAFYFTLPETMPVSSENNT